MSLQRTTLRLSGYSLVNGIALTGTVPLTATGWTWPETERRLAHTAFAVDEPNGNGHVVMLAGLAVGFVLLFARRGTQSI